ncbi:hypothetical protein CA85_13280 [Allorhodopirellula solitaria]|uniref:Uncharacterized protein n=1 Tax=Allorhodopirellula solitaria TaxID=2527987 RepID=A0A5C5YAZ2_9BACT|nr:hypothetical protein CA85_13280 [Allorhodopirellula solitaria]
MGIGLSVTHRFSGAESVAETSCRFIEPRRVSGRVGGVTRGLAAH